MPFCGNGWYSKISVQFMLHMRIIDFSMITHGINASCRLPSTILKGPLSKMENAWPDTELGRDLKQKSVNSLIGLMSVDESSVWMVKSCLTDESEN